jgi:hypothetical protein
VKEVTTSRVTADPTTISKTTTSTESDITTITAHAIAVTTLTHSTTDIQTISTTETSTSTDTDNVSTATTSTTVTLTETSYAACATNNVLGPSVGHSYINDLDSGPRIKLRPTDTDRPLENGQDCCNLCFKRDDCVVSVSVAEDDDPVCRIYTGDTGPQRSQGLSYDLRNTTEVYEISNGPHGYWFEDDS